MYFKNSFGALRTYGEFFRDNKEMITERNQRILVTMNMLYTAVLFFYNLVVPVYFADWNMTTIYRTFLLVQVISMTYVILRFGKVQRNALEVNVSCIAFQIYIMVFVITVSILPLEKNQPAMYFAPIAAALSIIFTSPILGVIVGNALEIIVLNVMSYMLKSQEVFYVNFFASFLIFLIILYITYVIYSSRIREWRIRLRIEHMSEVDMLTNVYNRAATEILCQDYIRRHAEDGFALAIVDVDNFKRINDTLGHPEGDRILKLVAGVLKKTAGERNIVGRVGGDEFVVFFKRGSQEDLIRDCLLQICREVRGIDTKDCAVPISCSIGVCQASQEQHMNYETLFMQADLALYKVKKDTKDGFCFYEEESHECSL